MGIDFFIFEKGGGSKDFFWNLKRDVRTDTLLGPKKNQQPIPKTLYPINFALSLNTLSVKGGRDILHHQMYIFRSDCKTPKYLAKPLGKCY